MNAGKRIPKNGKTKRKNGVYPEASNEGGVEGAGRHAGAGVVLLEEPGLVGTHVAAEDLRSPRRDRSVRLTEPSSPGLY